MAIPGQYHPPGTVPPVIDPTPVPTPGNGHGGGHVGTDQWPWGGGYGGYGGGGLGGVDLAELWRQHISELGLPAGTPLPEWLAKLMPSSGGAGGMGYWQTQPKVPTKGPDSTDVWRQPIAPGEPGGALIPNTGYANAIGGANHVYAAAAPAASSAYFGGGTPTTGTGTGLGWLSGLIRR